MDKNHIIALAQQYYVTHNKAPTYTLTSTELGFSPSRARIIFGTWNTLLRESSIPLTIHQGMNVTTNCANCKCEITVTYKLFHSKPNHFCSLSCAATINNKLRPPMEESQKIKISTTLKTRNALHPSPLKGLKKEKLHSNVYFGTCAVCNCAFTSRTKRKTCSPECKLSIIIKNGIRTHRINYKGSWFESSWEVKIAIFLDEHNISWVKPKFLPWIDPTGKQRRYFADFFLPQYNIYLDPKNPHRIMQDAEKLQYFRDKIHLIYGDVDEIINKLTVMLVQGTGLEPV